MGFRKRTFAFMLHGRNLIYWMQSDDPDMFNRVTLVQRNVHARRLRQLSEDEFVYQVFDADRREYPGEIMKIHIQFMTYHKI